MGLLSKQEQEIHISKSADEDVFSVYTTDPRYMRKLEKIGVTPYKTESMDGEVIGCYYKVNQKQITFKKERVLTDEQRDKLRKRMLSNLGNMKKDK